MTIHLRLELETENEKADWATIKEELGIKANTDALRALIRNTAKGVKV